MSQPRKRSYLILPPVLIGAGILAYQVAFKEPPKQMAPTERVRHVRVIEAAATAIVPRAIGYGSVKPARTWDAVAQVGGRLAYIHPQFKKGAILPAGTEIARIAPADYEIAIRQAEANIRAGEARLRELDVSKQNAEASLAIEKRALAIKEQELERAQNLLKRGTAAQASVDQKQSELLAQQKKVLDLENTIRLLPTQQAAQKEQIAVDDAQRETAQSNLARTRITLPFNARIAEATVEITQYVGTGTVLGSADGLETAEIEAQLPQAQFGNLIDAFVRRRPSQHH